MSRNNGGLLYVKKIKYPVVWCAYDGAWQPHIHLYAYVSPFYRQEPHHHRWQGRGIAADKAGK